MSSQQLLEPIIGGGIHSTNFFNGRRLTAEDLVREKMANRQHERLLGQAVGDGVVYGLDVRLPGGQLTGGTTLEIQKGLAINRNGDALYLPETITLSLVSPSDEAHIIKADFTDCRKVTPIEYPSNTGVYVVLIRPAADLSGSAPMSSIPDDGSIIGCGKSDLVEGVQFRTVKMDLNGPAFEGLNSDTKTKLLEVSDKTDDASVSMFRNIVAHACFGTEEKEKFIVDPFVVTDFSSYGSIKRLSTSNNSPNEITECDVPIAVMRWTDKKISYLDNWSVRRCPTKCTTDWSFSFFIEDRVLMERKAIIYQFREHLSTIIAEAASLDTIKAVEYFYYLPPIGILPIRTDSSGIGFNYSVFFEGITYREPVYIESAKFGALIRQALMYHPFKVQDKELVWLYSVIENRRAIDSGESISGRDYLIFTSGNVPYIANARYDASRWNYSNYGRV